ncbi:hypothetical protein PUN28_004071 [Cardiocondyla obscurior]|uniref:Uncharacterized protein n=1 Tax=Cardiocondyla obscurior TaxID=286306 RepID=A0AAW2GPF3_9HYME
MEGIKNLFIRKLPSLIFKIQILRVSLMKRISVERQKTLDYAENCCHRQREKMIESHYRRHHDALLTLLSIPNFRGQLEIVTPWA